MRLSQSTIAVLRVLQAGPAVCMGIQRATGLSKHTVAQALKYRNRIGDVTSGGAYPATYTITSRGIDRIQELDAPQPEKAQEASAGVEDDRSQAGIVASAIRHRTALERAWSSL